MLKWLIRNRLAAFERRYGYDTSYMRDMLAADTRAVLAFARAGGISTYRKDVPKDVYFAAKIAGAVVSDCGPCTQLVVAMALEAGVPAKTVASVLRGDATGDAALGAAFARAVHARDPKADELREEIALRWGPRAVISCSFAVVASVMYPTLKYALGHGHACRRVTVDGAMIEVAA